MHAVARNAGSDEVSAHPLHDGSEQLHDSDSGLRIHTA
jgi:hypothetical protein